jgi:hypothetical protein
LSIAHDLVTWTDDALPRMLTKIDEVLKSLDVTVAQAENVESTAHAVEIVVHGIGEAVCTENYDRPIAA